MKCYCCQTQFHSRGGIHRWGLKLRWKQLGLCRSIPKANSGLKHFPEIVECNVWGNRSQCAQVRPPVRPILVWALRTMNHNWISRNPFIGDDRITPHLLVKHRSVSLRHLANVWELQKSKGCCVVRRNTAGRIKRGCHASASPSTLRILSVVCWSLFSNYIFLGWCLGQFCWVTHHPKA